MYIVWCTTTLMEESLSLFCVSRSLRVYYTHGCDSILCVSSSFLFCPLVYLRSSVMSVILYLTLYFVCCNIYISCICLLILYYLVLIWLFSQRHCCRLCVWLCLHLGVVYLFCLLLLCYQWGFILSLLCLCSPLPWPRKEVRSIDPFCGSRHWPVCVSDYVCIGSRLRAGPMWDNAVPSIATLWGFGVESGRYTSVEEGSILGLVCFEVM